jgi:HEAT repeat protein
VVRVAAADALCRLGHHADALPALTDGLKHANPWVRLSAAIALDDLGDKARPVREQLQATLKRGNNYVDQVLKHALGRLGD